MKTISLINLKGGVGKTLLSTHLAYLAAVSWESRVLFIDNDKQGNATSWFGGSQDATLADIFLTGKSVNKIIQPTRYANIDLIAADMQLVDANAATLQEQYKPQHDILMKALVSVQEQYDLCIIDNPPDTNMTVLNALVITDDVVLVSYPEVDSLNGVYNMVPFIDLARSANPKLNIRGVVINKFVSSSAVYDFIDEIEKSFPVFQTKIHSATREAEKHMMQAKNSKQTIFDVMPRCRIAYDLMNFAEEMFEGGNQG